MTAPVEGEQESYFSNEAATFGDRAAAAREAAGLSQADLARRLGVKQKTVEAWEDDMSEPRANRLQMMAGMLNVSIRWLLTGEGDGVADPEASPPIPGGVNDILLDLRAIKVDHARLTDRLGQIEKRLRAALREG